MNVFEGAKATLLINGEPVAIGTGVYRYVENKLDVPKGELTLSPDYGVPMSASVTLTMTRGPSHADFERLLEGYPRPPWRVDFCSNPVSYVLTLAMDDHNAPWWHRRRRIRKKRARRWALALFEL